MIVKHLIHDGLIRRFLLERHVDGGRQRFGSSLLPHGVQTSQIRDGWGEATHHETDTSDEVDEQDYEPGGGFGKGPEGLLPREARLGPLSSYCLRGISILPWSEAYVP